MEYVIQPTVIPTNNYIASMVVLNTVTVTLVTLRLWTNWRHHKKWFSDDCGLKRSLLPQWLVADHVTHADLSVVGFVFVCSYSATSSMMNRCKYRCPKKKKKE